MENAPEDNRPATPPFALELTEEKRAEVLDYLLGELNESISSRSERMKKIIKWRRQREAVRKRLQVSIR